MDEESRGASGTGAAPGSRVGPDSLYYRTAAAAIVRDERQLLNCAAYLVADPARLGAWLIDGEEFRFLTYLEEPRSADDIEQYRLQLPTESSLAQRSQVRALVERLTRSGVIQFISADRGSIPPCMGRAPGGSRYVPATAPVTVSIHAPIEHRLLARLLKQCDEAGVLGIRFLGGRDAIQFLATAGARLRGVRAALSTEVCSGELDDSWEADLAAGLCAGEEPVSVVLKADSAKGAQFGARTLSTLGVPFSITYTVRACDGVEPLAAIASLARAQRAGFARFALSPAGLRAEGSESELLTIVREKLGLIRSVQDVDRSGGLQVRLVHLPAPSPITVPEIRVSPILSSYLDACLVGLIAGPIPGLGTPVGLGVPTPAQAREGGALLPPNCCQAGMTHMAVDRDGTVYPCEEAIGTPDLAMGSLATDSLSSIWGSTKWDFFRGGWDLHELAGCYECNRYYGCAARRCRVHPLRTLGNRLAPMPTCIACAAELGLSTRHLRALLGEDILQGRARTPKHM
jgi:radical SAM protein with 4Fe4S-binding SPASM domain